MSLIQTFLALAFRECANQLGFHGVLPSFSRGNLRLCLIDTGKCFRYARVLQFALPAVIFDAERAASTVALAWSTCVR